MTLHPRANAANPATPLPGTPAPFWEAFRTHVLAIVYLAPSIFIAFFSRSFLVPRLKQIWHEAELNTSSAKWLLEGVETTLPYLIFIALGFILFVVAAEITWHNWRRYRRAAVTVFMLLVHTAVLIWITAAAVCTTLAAPVLAHKKVKEFKTKVEQTSGDSSQTPTR